MIHNQKNQQEQLDDETMWNDLFYQVMEINRVKVNEVPSRLTNSFELIIVKEGKALMKLEQERFFLQAQDICVVHPSQVYSIQAKYDEYIEYTLCKFDVISKDGGFASLQDNHPFPLKGKQTVGQFPAILDVTEALYRLKSSVESLGLFHKRILFEQLIYLIVKNKKTPVEKDTLKAIEETRLFLENHFYENLSVDMLASKAEISPKYFSELFKKEYGISVSNYLTRLRVNKAKFLLVKSEDKIRDIASHVGYSDEFYLSRKFKQTVGISPSMYRKKRKKKVAAYDLSTTGHLLALNICPYAAPIHPKWTSHYYQNHRHEIPVHLSAFQINKDWKVNIETLLRNPPDLIISKDGVTEKERKLLSQIAPVFYYSQALNWREQLLLIAQHLGEEQEAEEWLQTYERYAVYTRNQLKKQVGKETFLPLRFYRGTLYFDHSSTIMEVFFGDLQMNAELFNDYKPHKQAISLAELADFNPDRLLLNICQESKTIESWESLQNRAIWNDLKAVRYHHVYKSSSDPWREYSASAHERVLKETLTLFGDCSKV
ncbi:ABC transporter substrate-binding protein [Metabacillus arenae]|uniref:AraC family transcriptional regulator n=1 Tax=Metabacillus arenae TaxID=2771434 RepID=A0A926NS07_9BACI|nr:AraC family transcriptional regulator [Metabacillus arenae]MBD1382821.1 AraC family transcriptional regulator [Metabacillus arenae]